MDKNYNRVEKLLKSVEEFFPDEKPKIEEIFVDHEKFDKLVTLEKTKYISNVVKRIEDAFGSKSTKKIISGSGEKYCLNNWSNFAKQTWEDTNNIHDFFTNINKENEKYSTYIFYNYSKNAIIINRNNCVCDPNKNSNNDEFCNTSVDYMKEFFEDLFDVTKIKLKSSILKGNEKCQWCIELKNKHSQK